VLDSCNVVARKGEVFCVGVPWTKRTELSAHDLLHAVFHRYVTLRTGWEWEIPLATDGKANENSMFGNFRGALRWLSEGRFKLDGLYEIRRPTDIQTIYQDTMRNINDRLVTLLDWRS
jgi:threonine dehydrogenase-like Zn-dependent dehydrogenase